MSVRHITYKDEKLPVKLGYYVLKMMQKQHQVSMEDLEGNFETYEPLLFYALEQGHKIAGKEFKYKMEDMVDILEDCFFEFVAIIPEFFPTDVIVKMTEVGGQAPMKRKKPGK